MTENWTLNIVLLNKENIIIKTTAHKLTLGDDAACPTDDSPVKTTPLKHDIQIIIFARMLQDFF